MCITIFTNDSKTARHTGKTTGEAPQQILVLIILICCDRGKVQRELTLQCEFPQQKFGLNVSFMCCIRVKFGCKCSARSKRIFTDLRPMCCGEVIWKRSSIGCSLFTLNFYYESFQLKRGQYDEKLYFSS